MWAKNKSGFTIIEVMIVLAIAAIILLVVLLGVAPAERRQRDNTRKNSAERTATAIQNYATEHFNDLSGFNCVLQCTDIPDPDSPTGHPVAGTAGVMATSYSGINYVIGAVCGTGDDAGKAVASSDARTYAVLYWMEDSNTSTCLGSSGQISTAASPIVSGGSDNAAWANNGGQYTQCIPSPDKCNTYSGGATYTAWAPTQFVYDVSDVNEGQATVTINYKNSQHLPSTYTAFNINVYVNGVKVLANQQLPVNTDGTAPGPFVKSFVLSQAPTSFSVEWTNDWCCGTDDNGNHEDANFVLLSASLKQRS